MTGWLTEGNVRRLLRSYDELVWVAQLLADTVAGTRNVHYKPTDARDYEISFGEDTVYARWYHHGDYDSVDFPLRCLWLGHDETVNIVARQIADEQAVEKLASEQYRAESEQRERELYEMLKAKYESV